MKVLVTGGLGFIGSHTVVALIENGLDVVIVDNLDNSSVKVHSNLEYLLECEIKLYQIDVRDRSGLTEVFNREKVDAVVHFAAKKSVNEALEDPLLYYDHNINGLITTLSVCQEFDVNYFIFSSSCTVYGNPIQLPVSEETPTQIANTPYGNTKRIGEDIIREYVSLKPTFKSILLRYFNPVGAHKSGLIGELPNGIPSNLMPFITQSAAGLRGPLQIFGRDYPTRDGTAIRDFIHVMDLAEAHAMALQYLEQADSNGCDIFNVGTGIGYTVQEIVDTFQEVNQVELSFEYASRRPGDIVQIWADCNKINKKMNWFAKRDLKEMCRSAWVWQRNLLALEKK